MISRCPSCFTRFDLSSLHLDQGGGVARCPSCGHGWLEAKAIEVVTVEATRPASPGSDAPAAPDPDIRQLITASVEAQEAFQRRRRHRRAAAMAWLCLGLVAISPAIVAAAFPERVVAAMPATIGLYDWMGLDVNIYGLKIREIDIQHLVLEGKKVIAIKGELANVSDRERKIPWLRFGLKADDDREVYHWQLDTESRPLRPGEVKGFITRVAAPPEAAQSVEIRFARADEIGSNASP